MTVHRDLGALEEQGAVRWVHGGVTVPSSNLVESTFLYRSGQSDREKDALAAAAAELIDPGQAIIIDDSTTTGRLTSLIPARNPLTVITNSLIVIDLLKDARGIETICLGGRYNSRFDAFFGYVCEQPVTSLRANILFMPTSTVFGVAAYHQQDEVVKTKRALITPTRKCCDRTASIYASWKCDLGGGDKAKLRAAPQSASRMCARNVDAAESLVR
jgi:DeoR/GlpR family transcriptional regulator of sugar metabolism